MKALFKGLSLVLAICLFCALLPAAALAGEEAEETSFVYTQTGNGAVIAATSKIVSVSVDDPSLLTVSIDGNDVTLVKKDGAAGIATVGVFTQDGHTVYEVPVGYTTFIFNGDALLVYEGSDRNYAVSGYDDKDAEFSLTAEVCEDGALKYTNGEEYRVNVAIKKKGGTYVFAGRSDDMTIEVKKAASDPAVLLFAGLDLTSSFTSPVTVKKESTSTVTINALRGSYNILHDTAYNDADVETDNVLAESAVIKAKAYADVTLCGKGVLELFCETKNALKVGQYGKLTIRDLSLYITSAQNGIASDNMTAIESGDIRINAEETGIRAEPDALDPETGSAANIQINGGSISINSGADGIKAMQDLTIGGGDFSIVTCGGAGCKSFYPETMSAKALIASSGNGAADATNKLTVTGGNFYLNTADDAVCSDGDVTVTGGTFEIFTGMKMFNAGKTLTLGEDGAPACRLQINVDMAYIALEGYEHMNVGVAHTYDAESRVEPESCIDEGRTVCTCTVCGAEYVETIIPAIGAHTPEEAFVAAENDLHTSLCLTCGDTVYVPCVDADEDGKCDICAQTLGDPDDPGPGDEPGPGDDPGDEDEGYAVTFIIEGEASVDVYYAQDYTQPDDAGTLTAVSRSGDTGKPDSSGDGQVNFRIVPAEGYTIEQVTIDGEYKNLKEIEAEVENVYRITKVNGELTVTVVLSKAEPQILYGDVNGDGAINKKDSLALKKYLADPENAIDPAAADVNIDGAVNKKDSLRLKQYLAGWDVMLGDNEPAFGSQSWLKWLTDVDAINNDPPIYKKCLSGFAYNTLHQGAQEPSPFELCGTGREDARFTFTYNFNIDELDATANAGTDDYEFLFEIWYRDAEADGDYKRIVTVPWRAYIFGGGSPYVYYNLPVYEEGMNDLTLEPGETLHEYEFVIIVYNNKTVSAETLVGWQRDLIAFTDSSVMFIEDAKEQGVIS